MVNFLRFVIDFAVGYVKAFVFGGEVAETRHREIINCIAEKACVGFYVVTVSMTRKNELNTQIGKKSGKRIRSVDNIVLFVELLKRIVLKEIVVHNHNDLFALLFCRFNLFYCPIHSCYVVARNNPISLITGVKGDKGVFVIEICTV